MGIFSTIRIAMLVGSALAVWFAYGWGSQIIQNYSDMQSEITTLKRDKVLIETRVTSYKTLLARRDAAIEASTCKDRIQYLIKNPDEIPTKFDPFNQLR